jgi:hypothetical protein
MRYLHDPVVHGRCKMLDAVARMNMGMHHHYKNLPRLGTLKVRSLRVDLWPRSIDGGNW